MSPTSLPSTPSLYLFHVFSTICGGSVGSEGSGVAVGLGVDGVGVTISPSVFHESYQRTFNVSLPYLLSFSNVIGSHTYVDAFTSTSGNVPRLFEVSYTPFFHLSPIYIRLPFGNSKTQVLCELNDVDVFASCDHLPSFEGPFPVIGLPVTVHVPNTLSLTCVWLGFAFQPLSADVTL